MKESSLRRFLIARHYQAKGILSRMLPARFKMLPSFMVIGAQKAGSTAMYDYLMQHPQVLEPWFKEMDFFNRRRMFADRKSYEIQHYQALFPLKIRARGGSRGTAKVTGEASQYLSYPEVPERIRSMFDEMKFIVLLRDPVKRALSHYEMRKRYGWEHQSFLEAFYREDAGKGMQETSTYKFRGLYAPHLENWFRHFPREQFLILESSKVKKNGSEAYMQVCSFLGLDYVPPESPVESNVGQYECPPQEELAVWREFYRPYNQRLCELLGENFDWE